MLVHIRHKLKAQLYLFERVSNNLIICTAAFISTCIGAARCLLDELFHSLLNIGFCFLFWCAHHTTFNVSDHEENQGHQEEDWNGAKERINF